VTTLNQDSTIRIPHREKSPTGYLEQSNLWGLNNRS
jgi:hypothetical protein